MKVDEMLYNCYLSYSGILALGHLTHFQTQYIMSSTWQSDFVTTIAIMSEGCQLAAKKLKKNKLVVTFLWECVVVLQ